MATFEELTNGTSEAAKKVAEFFTAICDTFSPIRVTTPTLTSNTSNTAVQTQSTTTPYLLRRSSSRKRQSSFFSNPTTTSKKQKLSNLIVVVHLLPTLPEYLRALQKIGAIKVIIFKGPGEDYRSKDMTDMASWVQNHHTFGSVVSKMTKDELKDKNNIIELLSKAADNNEEILIMDIGGYFAPCLLELSDPNNYMGKWKLLGIVEDTENGHQKYHNALQRFSVSPYPNIKPPIIYSVARSQMKMTEDYNVGKSLVRAADSILRQSLDLRLEDHCIIGVIGFGKIGSSIAMHLRQQHIGTVMVYDVNPAIMLRALSYDFVICTKDEMLQKASFIFCATGNKSLTYNDLLSVGSDINRLIIASCTSADDELDVHSGLKDYSKRDKKADPSIFSRYTLTSFYGKEVQIILLCDGNAVNFSLRAILGESIRSVQAAMIVCALKLQLMARKNELQPNILSLTNEDEMTIARLWLQHFPRLDVHLITNVSSARTKFDITSVEEVVGDLPVDEDAIAQLNRHLGLVRLENTDSIDFMDSERKLIITAPRGSGKTAVIFSLIHDVRNHYDLIWWFDCNDSLNSTLLYLAQVFRVSSIELSFDKLQEDVLKAVFSSPIVNNFLLVIDNVQELGDDTFFNLSANLAGAEKKTKGKGSQRQFKCHGFLSAINNAINHPSVRHQRRRHIVALYTDHSENQPPSAEPTSPLYSEHIADWLHIPLQEIMTEQAKEWAVDKLSSTLEPDLKANREKLIEDILSVDTRRLTIRLAALLLTSEWTKEDELSQIRSLVDTKSSSEIPDVLPHLIKLSLTKLKKENELFFHCIQVASLIRSGSISLDVFHRLYDILIKSNTANYRQSYVGNDWKSFLHDLLRTLKRYCILKQNLLAPMIHTGGSQRYVLSDYVEVYSMPSTYVLALSTPLSEDKKSSIWYDAVQLIYEGFNYDYYSPATEQNFSHYLDHATTLIKRTDRCIGNEPYSSMVGEILFRLGSYYLNERRMYSEGKIFYSKADDIFNNILAHQTDIDKSQENDTSLLISKWSAKLMGLICDQVSQDTDTEKDENFVISIDDTRKELEKITNITSEEENVRSRRYQLEAIIAVARIRVRNARNKELPEEKRKQWLDSASTELEKIRTETNMGTRTRSLLLQILGSTYSLLEDHEKAVDFFRQALKERESILSSEHLDVARAKYQLAFGLVEYIKNMSEEDRKKKAMEVETKLNEAQLLSETVFKIQKMQLSTEHKNLKECQVLRECINTLFEEIKSKEVS